MFLRRGKNSLAVAAVATLPFAYASKTFAARQDEEEETCSDEETPRRVRPSIADEIAKLRLLEKGMRERWAADEDGWRKLPARAWPLYQPSVDKIEPLREMLKECKKQTPHSDACHWIEFSLATALVFNTMDPNEGLSIYRSLGDKGYQDAMTAAGIVMVGALGVERDEEGGLEYIVESCKRGNTQGIYEMATLMMLGDVVREDEAGAFRLFEKAAACGHTAAEYMVADCLLEGMGCGRDGARAIPLLFKSAEKGHRTARRQLLSIMDGKWTAADGWVPYRGAALAP
eukprot:g4297.t1